MENQNLISFIEQLLQTQDCVIVPNFGGFVVNQSDFRFDEKSQTIHPKRRWVAFNAKLTSDDGLLHHSLAQVMGCSSKHAQKTIQVACQSWLNELHLGKTLSFGLLGTFHVNQDAKLIFEPKEDLSQRADFFRLGPVQISKESIHTTKKPVLAPPSLAADAPSILAETSTGKPKVRVKTFVWAGIIALLVGGLTFLLTEPNYKYAQSSFSPFRMKLVKKEVPKSNITSAKSNSQKEALAISPDSTLRKLEKPEEIKALESTKETGIYLVAGSFKTEKKALQGLEELKLKGLEAKLLPKEEGKYFRISVGEVESMEQGYQKAHSLKLEKKIDIWVFNQLNKHD